MILNESAVIQVLVAVESRITVSRRTLTRVPQFSIDKIHDVYGIIQDAAKAANCDDTAAYYALCYAADKKLVRATWDSDHSGIATVIGLTPDGHDYLNQLRKESVIL